MKNLFYYISILITLILNTGLYAQKVDTLAVNKKVNGEVAEYTYKIKTGNKVELKTVTIITKKLDPNEINKADVSLVVSKHSYCVYLLIKNKPVKAFKAVFGTAGVDKDKKMEGDKCTPEGEFTITTIRPHSQWFMFLGLSYPNEESYRKFEEYKRLGIIPATARIGGAVGIHGVFDNQNDVIERRFNWTDGCVCLRNDDLAQLVKFLQVGTKVKIIK